MVKIRRALISVSDKAGIVEFAKGLESFGVEMLSTGGTAKLLREKGIEVKDVSDYTGFPEMLDGRVKTLHPRIHGGLLALRGNQVHMSTLKEHNIGLIDMVVVNLYPFEQTVSRKDVELGEAIENIDIGGPSMLRSAAKNGRNVCVISNPAKYQDVLAEMKGNNGAVSEETCFGLAVDVFKRTSQYDAAIFDYLSTYGSKAEGSGFAQDLQPAFKKAQDLRYGENPHQKAAFYRDAARAYGLGNIKQLQGKELSFNNILDLDAAVRIASEFSRPAAVVIKHNNPCGVAEADNIIKAFKDAYACDPLSAFGGIIGINRPVGKELAKAIKKCGFLECVIAPGFDAASREVFAPSKNLRLIELADFGSEKEFDLKKVNGGLLVQDKDLAMVDEASLKTISKKKPAKQQVASLLFGWKVAKHVKSNAIVLASGTKTVGIGAGQMSRVDSVIIAVRKAGKLAKGSMLASDAFFPKADAVLAAAKAGIKGIIQPGGSISDEEVIKAVDKKGISMVFTGMRHFRH